MIDIIARGMIEESNSDISQLSEKVSNHTDDSDIHVTVSDKENWNSHPNDVMASGNPVQMDGLQEGVPFSEMVVKGKNLLTYPYNESTKTVNGITFTDNGDGTITANGKATANATFLLARNFGFEKEGNYFLSGCPSGGGLNSFFINWYQNHIGVTIKNYNDYGSGIIIPYQHIFSENNSLAIAIIAGVTVENVVFRPQIELGSTPTAYEPPITGRELTVNVNGTDYTVTPTSNPYVIPNDIRQQEGLNVVSVSEGELSVTGVRKNAAIRRIWDNMGMDLLFDGVTDESNPAVFDLTGYKTIEINHIIISNKKAYPVVIRMSIDNYLATPSTIISPIHNSSVSTNHSENDNISSLYAISAGGSAMTNTKIYGIK